MTSSGDPSPAGLPPSVTTIVQHHHPRACLPAPPVRFTPPSSPLLPLSPSCGNLPRNSALQTAGSDPSCVCSNNRRGRKSGRRFFSPSTRYGFHGSSLQPFRERGVGGGEKKKIFFYFLSSRGKNFSIFLTDEAGPSIDNSIVLLFVSRRSRCLDFNDRLFTVSMRERLRCDVGAILQLGRCRSVVLVLSSLLSRVYRDLLSFSRRDFNYSLSRFRWNNFNLLVLVYIYIDLWLVLVSSVPK